MNDHAAPTTSADAPAYTPYTTARRRRFPWVVAVCVAGAVSLLAVGATLWLGRGNWTGRGGGGAAGGSKFFTVSRADLDFKVMKDGELQAVNNIDILCRVEGQSTIVSLVKEGTVVRKGEVLIELDSADIRQKIADGTLEKQTAEADVKGAKEMVAIQKNQNDADLEAAGVELELAQLALEQYEQGTYPEELANAKTTLEMARITVKNKEEDLDESRGLYAKGFVTGSDLKTTELALTTAKNDLRKAETALAVLTDFTNKMSMAEKKSAVAQAAATLARTRTKGASLLAQAEADALAKEQALATKTTKLNHLKEQLEHCTIRAPADGMVIYAQDDRGGEGRVVEGGQVRERQQLLRLPDTTQMKAVLRINESQVGRLRPGQSATVTIVGVGEPVAATLSKISPLADGNQRWWNPDLKEYPVELLLEQTPPDLKPGTSVVGEVFTDRLSDVLAVPLAAIYSDRSGSFVFVRDAGSEGGGGLRPAPVRIGQANETHALIREGLEPGQQVLLLEPGQGRELLERAEAEGRWSRTPGGEKAEGGGGPEGPLARQPRS